MSENLKILKNMRDLSMKSKKKWLTKLKKSKLQCIKNLEN